MRGIKVGNGQTPTAWLLSVVNASAVFVDHDSPTTPPRYAAEAMHAAEEVRLLAAKLKAGDDKMRERLEQVNMRACEFAPLLSLLRLLLFVYARVAAVCPSLPRV